jgi:hypothetical protein
MWLNFLAVEDIPERSKSGPISPPGCMVLKDDIAAGKLDIVLREVEENKRGQSLLSTLREHCDV